MKITFLGAAQTVTGSCFLVETKNSKFIVDCGMFQGYSVDEEMNSADFQFSVNELDYVLLTHAHIDHSGRIPKLCKDGYKGEILATKATAELCAIMLPDSGHIQESEADWRNRKRQRAGKPAIPPMYTADDALRCLNQFRKVRYFEKLKLNDEISVRFNDAGHILGSSILEVWVMEGKKETKLVFSGDLGNKDMPILRDPSIIESADYLIMESTYGNRLHMECAKCIDKFINIIIETIDRGGNVIIPSFAVGRTQEVIYELNKHIGKYHEQLDRILHIPVFIDSPLAISATEVFRNNLECYDEEAKEYIANGDNPLDFPGLSFTRTAEESRELNDLKENSIIISASGMCEAGRIKHHLKHNLWRTESTVLFVGYQAPGTLGRRLVDGANIVSIFGEEIMVRAQIEMFDGFSGHADRDGLIDWLSTFKQKPKKVFLVHGEPESLDSMQKEVFERLRIDASAPEFGETYELKPIRKVKAADDQTRHLSERKYVLLNSVDKIKLELDSISEEILREASKHPNASSLNSIEQRIEKIKSAIEQDAS